MNERKITFLTFGLLAGCALIYNLFAIIGDPPHVIHLWRSTDCLSLTLNYYYNGLDFFSPEIHNYISDNGTSGKTAGEFTGWYFAMAALWQVFGVSEGLYRSMVAILFITSLLVVQRSVSKLIGHWGALFVVLWLFAQPALVYYGFGFLSNVPAFSFAVMGASFYIFFLTRSSAPNKDYRLLWLAVVFFAIGGLLKVTALLLFFTLVALIVLEWMGLPMLRGKKVFHAPFKQLAILSLVLLPNIAWYYWAASYNTEHGGKYTFNGVWPYWEADAAVKSATWEGFSDLISRQIMAPVNWLLMLAGVFIAVILALFKRISPILGWAPLILFTGSLLYCILWFQAWKDHDYYFINLYALPALVLVVLMASLKELKLRWLVRFGISGVSSMLLIYSVLYTKDHLALRYRPNYDHRYAFTTELEEGSLKYLHWDHMRNEYGLLGISDVMEDAGIGKSDLVVSVPDASFCITLYLMDRKGFTNMGDRNRTHEDILESIGLGAKYLVVNEAEYENDHPWILYFMERLVLEHKNIRVFDLTLFSKETHGDN